MSDDNQQMEPMEFLRANFFSSDNDMEQLRADSVAKVAKAQARREARQEIRALRRFVAELNAMDRNAQIAAIRWLCSKFNLLTALHASEGAPK